MPTSVGRLRHVRRDWLGVQNNVACARMLVASQRYFRALKREERFNPYHDELGRFTTADGATSPGSGTSDTVKDILAEPELHELLQNVAYPGDFHDVVRDYMVKGLRAGGQKSRRKSH